LNLAIDTVGDLNSGCRPAVLVRNYVQNHPFGYLFPELQNADALLPEVPETRARLLNLGDTMMEPRDESGDSSILRLTPTSSIR